MLGFLGRGVRSATRVCPPLSALGRGVEEALFRLAGDDSAHAVQEALITLGAFMLEVTRRTEAAREPETAAALVAPLGQER